MADVIKLSVFAVICCAITLTVRAYRPELAQQAAVATGAMVLIYAMEKLGGIFGEIKTMLETYGVPSELLTVLIKLTGIVYLVQFAADACRHCGAGGTCRENNDSFAVHTVYKAGDGHDSAADGGGGMNAADISTLDIGAWSELWNSLNGQSLGFTLKELMERFMGMGAMDAEGIWQRLIAAITGALKQNMLSYIAIIAVAFICAIVGIISAEDGAGGAGALVCAAIGTSAAAAKLSVLIASAYGAMDSLCSCMELIAPVLSAAIAASGEAASSAALSPLAAFLSGTVAGVFKSTVLPLCAGAGVCAMLSALTGEEKLSKLFKLIKSLIRWLSGAVFTLYFATVGIWGIGARSSDSVAVKTAKYAIDKGVPIVGGAVSGTVDTVLEGASLIKNSAGLAALVTLALVVLSPLASMACNAVCARGTAAVCSALGDARISTLMERVADAINGLFASVLAVAAMFMATCALALGTAGL